MNRFIPAIVAVLLAAAAACGVEPADLPSPSLGPGERPPSLKELDIASQKFASPLSVADAEMILLRTDVFEVVPSANQIAAYNLLLDQSDPLSRFRSIATKARRAGQLYALCALWALAPDEARDLEEQLVSVEGSVVGHAGSFPIAYLVERVRTDKLWIAFRTNRSSAR